MAEYIEREALLHDIEQSVVYTAREKITSAEMRGAHKVIERIKCAPAVEPIYIHEPATKSEFKRMAVQMGYEPIVHGRWEWLGPNRLVTDCMCGTCSACKVRSKYIVNTMLCPNCGAKMDGGADNAKSM